MRLEGSLEGFSLPDIFQLLSGTKKTGAMHLARAQQSGVVRLVDGTLSGASSDTAQQSLVRRLAGLGYLSDADLAAAVERVTTDPSVGLVRALKEAGAIDDDALLLEVAREHTVDTVFDILRWTEGDFAFLIGEPDNDDIGLRLPAEETVNMASERIAAWATLSRQIPSPDVVLAMTPSCPTDPTLTRDEWSLLALVDGRRSVGELAALCGRGEFAMVAALSALVERGLLVVPANGSEEDPGSTLARQQRMIAQVERGRAPAQHGEPQRAEPQHAEPQHAEPPRPRLVLPPPMEPPTWDEYYSGTESPNDEALDSTAPELPKLEPSVIEEDPAVNRSILMRLIAGVQEL